MDKRLIGKWYKEDMGETINIFDEMPAMWDQGGYF